MPDSRKLLSHLLLISLLIGTIPVALHISSNNASAAPDTHTWDGGGANALASTKENWIGDVAAPEALDSVVLDAGALPCTWDLAITLNAFSMNVGYSGTVTLSASFGTTSGLSILAGTLSAGSYTISCGGNWDSSTGSFSSGTGTVNITTAASTIKTDGGYAGGFDKLLIYPSSGTITTLSSISFKSTATAQLQGNGATLETGTYGIIMYPEGTREPFSGSGVLSGTTDWLYLQCNGLNSPTKLTQTNWILDKGVRIGLANAGVAPHLSSALVTSKDLMIIGQDAGSTLTLHTDGYSIASRDLTVANFGAVIVTVSTITSSGNWDSSAGTFYGNTSKLIMTGIGKTIKTANTNGAPYDLQISGTVSTLSSLNVSHNLTIDSGKSLTMGSGKALTAGNMTIGSSVSFGLQENSYLMNSLVNNGAVTQNGKRLNISGSSSTPLTGYGTLDGNLYLNGSTASSYEVQTGLPMGNLYTDRDTKISLDSTRYLRVVPASTEFVDVSIKSYGSETGCAARWTADSTGPVTYSLIANSDQLYDIWVDHTTRIGVVQTSSDGVVQFTYNGPFSSHEFIVSKSGGPSNELQASFSYSISGNMVSFTDKSYGGVASWLWNFGDGMGSTSQNPTHKYTKSGDYTISLTVYDGKGHSSTAKTTITLELGPNFPIERAPGGWNVWISDKVIVSVPALLLLVFGAWFVIGGYFPVILPLATPKVKKILGIILLLIAIYWFVFVDNYHTLLGWGSV